MRKLSLNELNRLSLEEFKKSEKFPIIAVLDNIRSLNNVGSFFRTADALKLNALYICGITAQPPHNDIHKTALGAEESVDWQYFDNTLLAIEKLKQEGYVICSVEQAENSTKLPYFCVEAGVKYAFVFGNEVKGVKQEVVNMSDVCLEIPQFGTKHSFNVAVSAGIVLWDVVRQMAYHPNHLFTQK